MVAFTGADPGGEMGGYPPQTPLQFFSMELLNMHLIIITSDISIKAKGLAIHPSPFEILDQPLHLIGQFHVAKVIGMCLHYLGITNFHMTLLHLFMCFLSGRSVGGSRGCPSMHPQNHSGHPQNIYIFSYIIC